MEITVSVSDLLSRIREISSDGMDFVTLSVIDADAEDDLPAALMFEAWSKSASFMSTQYDSIDAAEASN